MTLDYSALLKELQGLVTTLAEEATAAALKPGPWRDAIAKAHAEAEVGGRLEDFAAVSAHQRGVRFVLQTLYVRVLEDLDLLEPRRIKGQWSRAVFTQLAPGLGVGAYFKWIFKDVALDFPALLEDPWGPFPFPSDGACKGIWDLWHDEDGHGNLKYEWQAEGFDSRFLGDLYQDLDGEVRKRFALLQTPEFVESWILDHTLTPALEVMDPTPSKDPSRGFRVIDPTCGSGHFLVGAFRRLFALWREGGDEPWEAAKKALESVWGCDINPHAVDIARFRLILEARALAGEGTIEMLGALPLNLAVMDSLIPWERERREPNLPGEDGPLAGYGSEAERAENGEFLDRAFHVVVGNPPYITPKDVKKRDDYRGFWPDSCYRSYALSAPFAERFFDLGVKGDAGQEAAFVGQITANSFMKRQFGKALIENVFPRLDLTGVIDTSGAYIPGHGTPTVILFGRHQSPQKDDVWAILGKRGEPSRPDVPAEGEVWSAIINAGENTEDSSPYISVARLNRQELKKHPWSLSGGLSRKTNGYIEANAPFQLIKVVESPIGRAVRIGQDSVYIDSLVNLKRANFNVSQLRRMLKGEEVRDWCIGHGGHVWYPYHSESHEVLNFSADEVQSWHSDLKSLWPLRTTLANRATFQGNMQDANLQWFEFMQQTKSAYLTELSIPFAFVATHNHFVLDRGGKVFNRSAPVIKLPAEASEEDHLDLLGMLNSSTLGFWMKQVFHNKHGAGDGKGMSEEWMDRYEFDATKLKKAPLTKKGRDKRIELASRLDAVATSRSQVLPNAVFSKEWTLGTLKDTLEKSHQQYDLYTEIMCALQEELDWHTYYCYGLLKEDISTSAETIEPLAIGHRPFEILLAQADEKASEAETSDWWRLNSYVRSTEIPPKYAPPHRAKLQARLDIIASDDHIALLETPAFKRRWQLPDWDKEITQAGESWLLDHIESLFAEGGALDDPAAYKLEEIAAECRRSDRALEVAEVLEGTVNVDVERLVGRLMGENATPDNPYRLYSKTGLKKYRFWQKVWHLQDLEDKNAPLVDPDSGKVLKAIPVPPKFTAKDFARGEFYKLRGKLNVPRERFIDFAELPTPHYGWNGWRDLDRVIAQVDAVERVEQDEVDPLPLPTAQDPRRCGPTLGLWDALPDLKRWGDEDQANEMAGLAKDLCHQSRCPCQVVEYWEAAAREAGTLGKKKKSRRKGRKK